ncbi:MAG: TatD family hydrolase [Polyangia bacterium]
MLVDSHCHLEAKDFRRENGPSVIPEAQADAWIDERDEVVQRALDAGVQKLVCIGSGASLVEAENAVAWAERHPFIWATVGIHPHDAKHVDDAIWSRIVELSQHPRVVAIGETGLDYHYDHSPRDVQQAVFARFLDLANDADRPVTLHIRDAHEDARRIYARHTPRRGGVVHCFTGTPEDAKAWVELGLHVSFSGILTFKSAQGIQEAARHVPDDRILVETDCPYLAPIPYRGKRNEPAYVVHTAQKLAELRGISAEKVAQLTTDNASSLFRLL